MRVYSQKLAVSINPHNARAKPLIEDRIMYDLTLTQHEKYKSRI